MSGSLSSAEARRSTACRDLSARCRRPRCVSHSSGSVEGQRGDLEERVMDVTLRATRRANGRTHSAASAPKGTTMKGRRSSRSAAVVLAGCVGLAVAPGLALAAPRPAHATGATCETLGYPGPMAAGGGTTGRSAGATRRRTARRSAPADALRRRRTALTVRPSTAGPARRHGDADESDGGDRPAVGRRPPPGTPETPALPNDGLRRAAAAGLRAAAGEQLRQPQQQTPASRRRQLRAAPARDHRAGGPGHRGRRDRSPGPPEGDRRPAPRRRREPDPPARSADHPAAGGRQVHERQRRLPERDLAAAVPRRYVGPREPQHPAAGLLPRSGHDRRARLPRAPA